MDLAWDPGPAHTFALGAPEAAPEVEQPSSTDPADALGDAPDFDPEPEPIEDEAKSDISSLSGSDASAEGLDLIGIFDRHFSRRHCSQGIVMVPARHQDTCG